MFQKRLGEESFRTLFARVVEDARRRGLLQGEWVIFDGTKVRSHAAKRGTIERLGEGRQGPLKKVVQGRGVAELAPAVDDRWVKKPEELLPKEGERFP